jgi:hypothetical protein
VLAQRNRRVQSRDNAVIALNAVIAVIAVIAVNAVIAVIAVNAVIAGIAVNAVIAGIAGNAVNPVNSENDNQPAKDCLAEAQSSVAATSLINTEPGTRYCAFTERLVEPVP